MRPRDVADPACVYQSDPQMRIEIRGGVRLPLSVGVLFRLSSRLKRVDVFG